MKQIREAPALYVRIVRTYFSWAGTLLPLAVCVFIPLGLVHAIPVHLTSPDLDVDGGARDPRAGRSRSLALAATGLIGEVFYAGAVAIALTHPHDGKPPSLREVARMVSYRRLIAVDLLYGVLVAVGLARLRRARASSLYVYLGLAAPVVEIEQHGVRAALARSFRLVRGHFWLVFVVLIPLEVGGDAITNLAIDLCPRPARRLAARRVARRHRHQHRLHPLLRGRRGAAHPGPDRRQGGLGAATAPRPAGWIQRRWMTRPPRAARIQVSSTTGVPW